MAKPEVLVRTGSGGGDCGYEFILGGVYVVYAHRRAAGDTLGTSICSRTRPLSAATEDLADLPPPAYARVDRERWAAYGPPDRCPVHPAFPVLRRHSWVLFAPEGPWDATAFEAATAAFPHAGLDVIVQPDPDVRNFGVSLHDRFVCAACREDAVQWSYGHGAICHSDDAPPVDAAAAPVESREEYRRRRPRGNFAFLFDDGRRLRLDTIEGRLVRSYGAVHDTTIAFALADTTLGRLYELAIEHRLFDRPAPHPRYTLAGAAGGPACTRVDLFVRSDTLVREYHWDAALAPGAPARDDPWAGFRAFADAIVRAIEAHPAHRALPALPAR